MNNNEEVTTAQMMDWLEGRLAAAEADRVATGVAADPALQSQVDWLREFLEISRETVLATPPTAVRQTALAAFAAYAEEKRLLAKLKTLLAELITDSWQRPALANVRNVNLRSEPRQLIYGSETADIALNVHLQPGSGQIDLDGQIFPLDETDPADFLVQLLQEGVEQQMTTTDSLGKFSFPRLTSGTYTLLCSSGEIFIAIDALTLQL